MSDTTEDYKEILKNMQEELTEQRMLLNTVIKELGIIKEMLTLSSQMTRTFTPNSALLNQTTNIFPRPDGIDTRSSNRFVPNNSPTSPLQLPFAGTNEILVYLQKFKENQSESSLGVITEQWKRTREAYQSIIQAKNDEEPVHVPILAKTFVKQVLILMYQIFKPTLSRASDNIEDIATFMRELGPVPIMLNYDLVEFVNTISTNPSKRIGKKTLEQLYKYLDELYISVSDVLDIIMKA